MMPQRLSLPDTLYPVQAFFNRLSHDMFKKALRNFADGTGYNPEDMTCFFPREIAEDTGVAEDQIAHIELWTYAGDQEVLVPLGDFITYLKAALEVEDEISADADFRRLGDAALATLQAMRDAREKL